MTKAVTGARTWHEHSRRHISESSLKFVGLPIFCGSAALAIAALTPVDRCAADQAQLPQGAKLVPTRDANVCPDRHDTLASEAARNVNPDAAAQIAEAGHCILAMSPETVAALGGAQDTYEFVSRSSDGLIVVKVTSGRTVSQGFALSSDFRAFPKP